MKNTDKRIKQLNRRIEFIENGNYHNIALYSGLAVLIPAIGISIVRDDAIAATISTPILVNIPLTINSRVPIIRENAINELHGYALEENEKYEEERAKKR